ncbi:MAG TPA: DUF4038 domain-containing protein [Pirellulales bacterium]|nr:DUF4038 domain-containing protein [Pirellulales bacterium]
MLVHRFFACPLIFGLLLGGCAAASSAAAEQRATPAGVMVELSFTSNKNYPDPFHEVQLDALVTAPDGSSLRVPGFWAGGQTWKVRYSSPTVGVHRLRTECSDAANASLHGVSEQVEVVAYQGDNPLYQHGALRVAADRRHFEHRDGTPFLWLADTWWMGLCERIGWPAEFQALAADRREKGFNVVQIVAGLYPDMPAFDERGRNEAGFPWEKDYSRIRPDYFDAADKRIVQLVDSGIVPCVVGAWGYHLPWLGVERMKQHWRYLVARYGALPAVWCIAGEGDMPYYLSQDKEQDKAFQRAGWSEVAAYVRALDPFHHLLTIHPVQSARQTVLDPAVLDFDMLQTGHGDRASIAPTVKIVRASHAAWPPLPTVVGEVCYEGILNTCFDDVQRFMVWSSLLAGNAGHTYGANGIWQLNREGQPYGLSPHGGTWGATPWNQAMKLPGSRQVGLAKRFLERFPWQQFEPHNDWATAAPAPERSWTWKDWIWFPEGNPADDAPAGARFFRRAFEIPAGKAIARAELRAGADDKLVAYLNGQSLGAQSGWVVPKSWTVEHRLTAGRNVLAIRAENNRVAAGKNPAGLLCRLEVEFADGTTMAIDSDAAWRASDQEIEHWQEVAFDDQAWSPAARVAEYGQGPWGAVGSPNAAWLAPFAAGIPGQVRVIYCPTPAAVVVHALEPRMAYMASYFDPAAGERSEIGVILADARGDWTAAPPEKSAGDWVLLLEARPGASPEPISIHPENSKYFLFRGRPLVLLTASEHYGSVVNRAFDFERYLADAADKQQTLTRTFLSFREQQSSRNPSSPIKPESPDFITPYPRVGPSKAMDGEPMYDLDQWNDEYFARLRKFLSRASQLGIVVELTLFSNTYGDPVWALNPLRAANNLQKIGAVEWQEYTSLTNRPLNDRQFALAAKIVRETSGFDNVYYEICNEPGGGFAGHATPQDVDLWQAEVARVVRDELRRLSRKHLVFASQAFSYTPQFTQPLDATFTGALADAVNVHPLPNTVLGGRAFMLGNFMSKELKLAELSDFCRAAGQYSKPFVLDEDNAASMYRDPTGWTIHRKRAWVAALHQGHYDFIDFSITVGSETGTQESNAQIRTWMKHLSEFIHRIDFIHARPLANWIEGLPPHVVASTLAVAGQSYVTYLADAREVTDPSVGSSIAGRLSFRLPEGTYRASYFSPTAGCSSPGCPIHGGSEPITLELSPFEHDLVLEIKREP